MKKAKMILDRFFHPPKLVICIVPTISFAALIFVFALNKEETDIAYPIFFLSAYSIIILLAALPTLAGRLKQLKSILYKRENIFYLIRCTIFE